MQFTDKISVELSEYIREWTTTKEREEIFKKYEHPAFLNQVVYRLKNMSEKYKPAIYEVLKLAMLNRIEKNHKGIKVEKSLIG